MNHFILDFSEIKTVLELHQYLKGVFDLPDCYGNNMDALWDSLSCRYDETTTIELRNLAVLRKRLAHTEKMMLKVFEDLHEEDGVAIRIIDEAAVYAQKCCDVDNDDLSDHVI